MKFRAYRESTKQWVYGVNTKDWHKPLQPNEFRMSKFWELVEEGVLINVCRFIDSKDKNGTEIYEGAMVTVNTFNYGLPIGMPIQFINGRWEIVWREKHWHPNGEEKIRDIPLTEVIEGVEVIGKIYENPELLEANQSA